MIIHRRCWNFKSHKPMHGVSQEMQPILGIFTLWLAYSIPSPFSWNLLRLLNSRPLQKQPFQHAHRVTHSWTRFPYSVLQKNIHDKQIFQQARFQVSDFEARFKKSQMFMNLKIMTVLIGQCPICRVMIALTPQTIRC